jgi:hypothetical protein
MRGDSDSDTTSDRRPRGMSEQRQQRIRLEISREAARLFWEQGVAATSGEQIANAVGISVRTLWRYSLEDHLVEWATNRPKDADQRAYDEAVIKMTVLGEKEPDLRAAWLMTNDRIERELVGIIADRLRRPTDDLEVRLHAATITAVVRVIGEDGSAALMAGVDRAALGNPIGRIAHAVRVATGGVVGDPVEP